MVQFVFGYGVGGEYPMAAGSAAERAEAGGRKTASKRGREVRSDFLRSTKLISSCFRSLPSNLYRGISLIVIIMNVT